VTAYSEREREFTFAKTVIVSRLAEEEKRLIYTVWDYFFRLPTQTFYQLQWEIYFLPWN